MSRPRHPARALLGFAAVGTVAAAIVLPVQAQSPPTSQFSVGPSVHMPLDPRVYVIRSNGGGLRRVTPRGMFAFDPEWNPRTGALMAVTERGIVEIGLGRSLSTRGLPVWARRVTVTPAMAWSPSFSPDGAEIALVTGSRSDLWILERGTGEWRQLTTGWHADGFVDWSPDGSEIAVARQSQILVVDRSGVVARPISGPDQTCMLPAWSPRGRRIAFTCLFPDVGIAVTDASGGSGERLTRPGVPSAYAAWSPNGKRLAYAKFVDGSWDLFVQELQSGREHRLTRTPYDEVDPAWSPSGAWLAFTSNERPAA